MPAPDVSRAGEARKQRSMADSVHTLFKRSEPCLGTKGQSPVPEQKVGALSRNKRSDGPGAIYARGRARIMQRGARAICARGRARFMQEGTCDLCRRARGINASGHVRFDSLWRTH